MKTAIRLEIDCGETTCEPCNLLRPNHLDGSYCPGWNAIICFDAKLGKHRRLEECIAAEQAAGGNNPVDGAIKVHSAMSEPARIKAKEAIRRLRARQSELDEKWLDACADAHGMGQECERAHAVAFLRSEGHDDLAKRIEVMEHTADATAALGPPTRRAGGEVFEVPAPGRSP